MNVWDMKLGIAIRVGDINTVNLCLQNGADINYKATSETTPFMNAAFFGRLDIAQLLLERGCKTDTTTNNGRTALHLAAEYGHLEVVRYLVEHAGFQPLDKTHEGETPYDIAAKKKDFLPNNKKVMEYLQFVTSKDDQYVSKMSVDKIQKSNIVEVPRTSNKLHVMSTKETKSEKSSSEFERKIYQAFRDKSYRVCKFLLDNDVVEDVYQVLSKVLTKAFETKDSIIQNLVFSCMVQESPKIVKQFCMQYADIVEDANVWMAVKCTCDKANQIQYESVPCRNADLIFVTEKLVTSDYKFPKQFLGFQTLFFDSRAPGDNEAATVAKEAIKFQEKVPIKVPGTLAKTLFKQHCNLTMVCPSVIKSTGFLSGSATLQETNCIQFICKKKGIIPIGEFHFPLKVDGVPTDVLEGTFQLLSAVQIGDSISNQKGATGTLGGFVKYYGIDTFLTCSHVVFGKNDLLNLQKKDFHFESSIISISNERQPIPVDCVLIRHALKYDTSEKPMEIDGVTDNLFVLQDNPEETSIDAALLLIQTPENSNPTLPRNVLERKIIGATVGTPSCIQLTGENSEYLNKQIPDHINSTGQAFALAGSSGRQETNVMVNREEKVIIPYTGHINTSDNLIFYNQLILNNMEFQPGDSGTCIFGRYTTSGQRGCIGMLIGQSTTGQYIVTPMKDILNALGVTKMH